MRAAGLEDACREVLISSSNQIRCSPNGAQRILAESEREVCARGGLFAEATAALQWLHRSGIRFGWCALTGGLCSLVDCVQNTLRWYASQRLRCLPCSSVHIHIGTYHWPDRTVCVHTVCVRSVYITKSHKFAAKKRTFQACKKLSALAVYL